MKKEHVLSALRQKKHVSGEDLGRQLHVSRAAVWKCIGQLRRRGYDIESSPGLGYTLVNSPDRLTPEEILVGLNTKYLGKRIEYYEELDSTQERARHLALKGAPEGTIVVAEKQAKGRGRLGRNWISPSHAGIYVSIILRPNLKPFEVCQLPLIAGVAASEAIARVSGLQARIKWPNDVMVAGRKVAGILAEMGAEVDRLHYIVLGIGMNVNTRVSTFPHSVREIATSVASQSGQKISRVKLLQAFLEELEGIYEEFKNRGFEAARKHWKELDTTIGSRVRVITGDTEFEGKAIDIDKDGALIIKRDDGSTERIIAGDVSLRPLTER